MRQLKSPAVGAGEPRQVSFRERKGKFVAARTDRFGHLKGPDTLERTASVGAALLGHQLMYGPRNLTAWALSGSPEELESAFRQFAQEGISHVQVFLAPCTPSGIEAFAPVLELLDSA